MIYYGQNEQDKILNEKYFKNMRDGIFVDVGAHDGINGSNTFFFEKELNWRGILFEPIPEVFERLKENRTGICFGACAWVENTMKEFRLISGHSEMLSGLTDTYHPSHQARISKEFLEHSQEMENISVCCFDINDILDDAPDDFRNIDLFSIDTEGSEEKILRHLNYDKFKIGIILTENNYGETSLKEFLETKGFEWKERIGADDVYVSKIYEF